MRADDVAMIVHDPLWLPHRYDPGHDAIHFVRMSRDLLRDTTFLIDTLLPKDLTAVVLGREESLAAGAPIAPLHFIFHSAYCCSTLLARALDQPGVAMALKEPTILNDVVGWQRQGAPQERVMRVLGGVLDILARPIAGDRAVIAKPSNVLNALIAPILSTRPGSRALLLHAPLPVFLGSIARKGMWGALWVREYFIGARKDGITDLGFDTEQYFGQSDLQIAAMGWLAQQKLFDSVLRAFGPARVRSIDSETLVGRREEALGALSDLFGLSLGEQAVARIARGPVFERHSKFATPFGTAERGRDQNELSASQQDEIAKIVTWTEAVAASARVPLRLGSPLIG